MSRELKINDSASNAPEEVRRWAHKIATAHGCPVTLSRERSGYHLYMPCPDCLHTHGRRELDDPKYSINLSILAGLGEHRDVTEGQAWRPNMFEDADSIRKRREYGAGVCMRTRSSRSPHMFPMELLLNMSTVSERHPDIQTRMDIRGGPGSEDIEEMWEEDATSGKLCPPPPGETVLLSSLPVKHPAVQYMLGRGYNVEDLEKQFRAGFCVKEYPIGQKDIFYRKMPGGWKDSPQHRVTFMALVDGVPLSWQARLIEKVSDDGLNRYMLHPYGGGFYPGTAIGTILSSHKRSFKYGGAGDERQLIWDSKRNGHWLHVWSHTHTRANPAAPWQPVSPFDEIKEGTSTLKFKPAKYRTAKYSTRQLMGWDAAFERAANSSEELRWAVLCEGPLDAARIGPGGLAVTGSSLSPENATKIVSYFHIVFLAFDDDVAGREATEKIASMLQSSNHKAPVMVALSKLELPQGKDPGDLSPEEYQRIFTRAIKRIKRSL